MTYELRVNGNMKKLFTNFEDAKKAYNELQEMYKNVPYGKPFVEIYEWKKM